MTKHDTERVTKLLNADLTYDPDVEQKYDEASHERMSELRARLLGRLATTPFDAKPGD